MIELETKRPLPLRLGDDGVIRISGSRVTLDSVVREFQQGATPEQIQEDFPSLTLKQIYAVVTYFLENTRAVEDYLQAQKNAALKTRRGLERNQGLSDLRQRLRKRRGQAVR